MPRIGLYIPDEMYEEVQRAAKLGLNLSLLFRTAFEQRDQFLCASENRELKKRVARAVAILQGDE